MVIRFLKRKRYMTEARRRQYEQAREDHWRTMNRMNAGHGENVHRRGKKTVQPSSDLYNPNYIDF